MSVLLLRLAAPLQAWGSASKFNRRLSEREPTKSGVIGLVAAALGRRRTDPIDDLAGLRFGVRTDQPGQAMWDFHTAHTEDGKHSFVSTRQYLADAVFLAGLEGGEALLREIAAALDNPVFPLYLGRRSCPPTGRVSLGLSDKDDLLAALQSAPWQAAEWHRRKCARKHSGNVDLEIVHDASAGDPGAFTRRDAPESFSQEYRRCAFRFVIANPRGTHVENGSFEPVTRHDPIASLEGNNVSVTN